jgi:hypothetical protein
VIRNLLSDEQHAALDIDKLAEHITEFSLQAIEQRAPARRAGAKR